MIQSLRDKIICQPCQQYYFQSSIAKIYRLSNGEHFDRLDVEPTDLPLHPQTVGPQETQQPTRIVPTLHITLHFPHEEGLPLHQPWQLVSKCEVLLTVPRMSHLESYEEVLKIDLTLIIRKLVPDEEMDENYIFFSPDLVNRTTFIFCLNRSQVFSSSMSDYFFCGGIVFSPIISIGISNMSGMMSCLIVIALCIELEMPHPISEPLIIVLKVLSSVDVPQVRAQSIATAGHYEIDHVRSDKNASKNTHRRTFICNEEDNCCNQTSDKDQVPDQSLAVHRGFLGSEVVGLLSELFVAVVGVLVHCWLGGLEGLTVGVGRWGQRRRVL